MEISLFQFFLFSCSSHSYNFLVFHKLKEKKGEKKEKKKKKKKKKGKKGGKTSPTHSPKISQNTSKTHSKKHLRVSFPLQRRTPKFDLFPFLQPYFYSKN